MTRTLSWTSHFAAIALATSVAFGQTHPALDARAMDRAIRAQVDSGFTGVVLVANGHSVVLRRAYGKGKHRPTETSAFWIASITKSFTTAAILTLEHDGRLSVHDSIFRFFPDAPSDKRSITIHQLLTHTAGFGRTYSGGGLFTRRSAARAILAQPLAYAPGLGYRYGDDDYELLGAVIEVVTGRRWQDVVRERILEPVGLTHTGFWCGPWTRAPRPVASANAERTQCVDGRPDWGHIGANGMSATADDLLRWVAVLGDFGRGTGRFPMITTPHVFVRREGAVDVYSGYGVRLYLINHRVVEIMYSGSGDDGHTSIVRQMMSGPTIVVLSNAGQHKGTTWSSYVASLIAPRKR